MLLLGEQRHDECEQFAKSVIQQRHDCDLNPGPSVPESSTLTTRLLRYPTGALLVNKPEAAGMVTIARWPIENNLNV